jgi:hypothetical protein
MKQRTSRWPRMHHQMVVLCRFNSSPAVRVTWVQLWLDMMKQNMEGVDMIRQCEMCFVWEQFIVLYDCMLLSLSNWWKNVQLDYTCAKTAHRLNRSGVHVRLFRERERERVRACMRVCVCVGLPGTNMFWSCKCNKKLTVYETCPLKLSCSQYSPVVIFCCCQTYVTLKEKRVESGFEVPQ